MAVSFVGSGAFALNTTTAQTVSLTNLLTTTGATATLAVGDVVVVNIAHAGTTTRTAAQLLPTTTGYAAVGPVVTSTDSNITSHIIAYKRLTAVDTSFVIPGSATATTSIAGNIHVFRGVDENAPFGEIVTATGIDGANPNPPAITPVVAGSWIYVAGGAAATGGTTMSQAGDLSTTTNHFRFASRGAATNDASASAGIKTNWTSGSFDPGAWTGNPTTNTGSWSAQTVIIHPVLPALTGTVSATQDSDTLTATGTLPVIGTVTATQASDALTATGTLPIKGSVTATQADNTLTATGTLPLKGSVTATQASNTITASALLKVLGATTATQASDTITASGTLPIKASVTATQASNTITATGSLAASGIFGSVTATQASDTLTSSAVLKVSGSTTATQASDVLTASGKVALKASVTATQANNTLTASAVVALKGSVTATQAANTLTATGKLALKGSATATQASNTLTAAATLKVAGTVTATQASNTLTATAVVKLTGATTATQASNTLTASGTVALKATTTATQDSNTLTATSTIVTLPGYRHWRLIVDTLSGFGSFTGFGEIEFRATLGGADQANGGVVTAISTFDGTAATQASNAFANDGGTTAWISGDTINSWIAYQFPGNTVVRQLALTNRSSSVNNGNPLGWRVQRSSDGVNWTTEWTVSGEPAWGLGETRLYTNPVGLASGSVTATQANNSLTATGKVAVKATTTATQGSNTVTATGKLAIKGAVTATQQDNTPTTSGVILIRGQATALQDDNVLTAEASVESTSIFGSVTVTQGNNVLFSNAVLTPLVITPVEPPKFKRRGTPINAYKQFKTLRSFRSR